MSHAAQSSAILRLQLGRCRRIPPSSILVVSAMKPPLKLKLSSPSGGKPDNPEALFRDLKSRSPQIQHLWSHQADILRAYHKEVGQKDVALELPTGTGKTLVGLLIAEWRRIALGERAVYLCPTRQLARQVGLRAIEYG